MEGPLFIQTSKWVLFAFSLYLSTIFTLKYFAKNTFPFEIGSYIEQRRAFIYKQTDAPDFDRSTRVALWGTSDVEFLPTSETDRTNFGIFNFGIRCAHPEILLDLADRTALEVKKRPQNKWKKSIIFFQSGILTERFNSMFENSDYLTRLKLAPARADTWDYYSNFKNNINSFVNNTLWVGTNSADGIAFLFLKFGIYRDDIFWFDQYLKVDLLESNRPLWSVEKGGGLNYESDLTIERQHEFRNRIPLNFEIIIWQNLSDILGNNYRQASVEPYKKYLEQVANQSEKVNLVFLPQNPFIQKYLKPKALKNTAKLKNELCLLDRIECVDYTAESFEQKDFADLIHYSDSGWLKIKKLIF